MRKSAGSWDWLSGSEHRRDERSGTGAPVTIRDWLLLPEEALSLCTNGEVFLDPLGSFTGMRRALLA